MAVICRCGNPYNTGLYNQKSKKLDQPRRLFLTYLKANDGTKNKIATTDTVDQAFLDALLQNEEATKRLYPINWTVPQDVEFQREDSSTQTFDTGNSAVTTKGVRPFVGFYAGAGVDILNILESFKCEDIGFYYTDDCGQLDGAVGTDGDLYPIPIFTGSLDTKLMVGGSSAQSAGVMLRFELDQIFKDTSLGYIKAESITADLEGAEGLIHALPTLSAVTTTGLEARIYTLSGAFNDKVPVEGLVAADFTLQNLTNNDTVTIDSVTESTVEEGLYTFDFTGDPQTSADILRLISASPVYLKGVFIEPTKTTVA